MLRDLGIFTGGTQVHLIAQGMTSIFSQAANQSTDLDILFQVSNVLTFFSVSTTFIWNLFGCKVIWETVRV